MNATTKISRTFTFPYVPAINPSVETNVAPPSVTASTCSPERERGVARNVAPVRYGRGSWNSATVGWRDATVNAANALV